MSLEETTRIAGEFLARLGAGADHEIAALFSTDLDFEIAGDVGALPWIGKRFGRSAAADFFRDVRRLIEPLRFEIHDVLTNETGFLPCLASSQHTKSPFSDFGGRCIKNV